MTDVPNDTIAANRDTLAAEWLKVTKAYPPPISKQGEEPDPREALSLGDWIVGELRSRDADLDRLAGPVCEHDGRRAIEHARSAREEAMSEWAHVFTPDDKDGSTCMAVIGRAVCGYTEQEFCHRRNPPHPSSPAIEEFLRRGSR